MLASLDQPLIGSGGVNTARSTARRWWLPLTTLILGAAIAIAVGTIVDDDDDSGDSGGEQKRGLLLVESAQRGQLNGGRTGQLILTGVSGESIGFTDRPERKAYLLHTLNLNQAWPKLGFNSSPPNAALVGVQGGRRHVVVVQLGPPTVQLARQRFTYPFRIVSEAPGGTLDAIARSAESVPSSGLNLTDVSLFIDPTDPIFQAYLEILQAEQAEQQNAQIQANAINQNAEAQNQLNQEEGGINFNLPTTPDD